MTQSEHLPEQLVRACGRGGPQQATQSLHAKRARAARVIDVFSSLNCAKDFQLSV